MYQLLQEKIKSHVNHGICVAFSGGVDSAVVLAVAVAQMKASHKVNCPRVLAVTFETFLHPHGDLLDAKRLALQIGATHQTIQINEMDNPNVLQNSPERCFYCKEMLFSHLRAVAQQQNLACVMDGTNADDLLEYRPGLRALKQLDIYSPLSDCGINKKAVRQIATSLGLSVASKPSAPCLATRLPYGTPLTPALLSRIDQAEQFLKGLGFSVVRVRVHEQIARVEILPADFSQAMVQSRMITDQLNALGFCYVTLDLAGFRSGSMDVGLTDLVGRS